MSPRSRAKHGTIASLTPLRDCGPGEKVSSVVERREVGCFGIELPHKLILPHRVGLYCVGTLHFPSSEQNAGVYREGG
jgi:hypothetical protein